MESLPTIAAMQQSIGGSQRKFITSDENATIKEIEETHAPDGRDIDAKSILQIVEDIFNSATPIITEDTSKEAVSGDASKQADVAASKFEQFTYIVNQLSSEISYKCTIGVEGHSTTVSLFRMLSSYSWNAKLVLTLAAFALIYGEFLLHSQVYSSNKLVRRMAILKQSPDMTVSSVQLKPIIDAQNNLIQSILDLVKSIIAFKELPTRFLSADNAAFSAAITIIPTASYWIIRSVIVCATNITYHSGTGHKYTIYKPEDISEVSVLNHEIKTMNDYLQKQLAICHHNIEERKHHVTYEALLHSLEGDYVDNMRSLKLLIGPKNDAEPLFDGSKNKRVGIEVLKGKTVLLLIADMGAMSERELFRLDQFYRESRKHTTRKVESQYDIIWIPMVNPSARWTEETQKDIESTQMQMPWLSLYNPRLIDQVVMRFIKEKLQFKDKPVLMVIDPLGKIVNFNALPVMYIWGNHGFPFSTAREKALWKEATWGLELLVGDIIVHLATKIRQERHIFLYGGDDFDWVAEFALNASKVAETALISLEMIYIGRKHELGSTESLKHELELKESLIKYQIIDKSWLDSRPTTGRKHELESTESLIEPQITIDRTWLDTGMTNLFWTRLETMISCISSKNQLGNNAAEKYQLVLLPEIKNFVENGTSGSMWAVYSKGGDIAINGSGTIFLSALREYENWEQDVKAKGFHVAFKEYYDKLYDAAHPGYSIEFPATTDRLMKIPQKMDCPKCNYIMQKYVNFSCSHSQSENP